MEDISFTIDLTFTQSDISDSEFSVLFRQISEMNGIEEEI